MLGGLVTALALLVVDTYLPEGGDKKAPARTKRVQAAPVQVGQASVPTPSAGSIDPDERFTPEQRAQGGPYNAFPLSHPKVLGGLLYFEAKLPALAVTRAQCTELVPLLKRMGKAWMNTLKLNPQLRSYLTEAQERHLIKNKSLYEATQTHQKAQHILEKKLKEAGDSGHAGQIARFFKLRAAEGAAGPVVPRTQFQDALTNSDITTGLLLMESDTALRLTPGQAKAMAPLLDKIESQEDEVREGFTALIPIMSEQQIQGVIDHIKEIVPYKAMVFGQPGSAGEIDPLCAAVRDICLRKVGQDAAL